MNWLKKLQQEHTSSRTTTKEKNAHTNALSTTITTTGRASQGSQLKEDHLMDRAWNKYLEYLAFSCSAKLDTCHFVSTTSMTKRSPHNRHGLYHRSCCTEQVKRSSSIRESKWFWVEEHRKTLQCYSQGQQPYPAGRTAHVFVSITRATEKTRRLWCSLEELTCALAIPFNLRFAIHSLMKNWD